MMHCVRDKCVKSMICVERLYILSVNEQSQWKLLDCQCLNNQMLTVACAAMKHMTVFHNTC